MPRAVEFKISLLSRGQLGVGVTKQEGVADKRLQMCFPKPTLVKLNRVTILKVACGAVHTAIISSQGDLYTFGCGNGGRLGHGDNQDAIQPRLVDTLKEERVLVVCCSNWHTLCISASRSRRIESDSPAGWVYSFGSGINGQLGLGKQRAASYPSKSVDFGPTPSSLPLPSSYSWLVEC